VPPGLSGRIVLEIDPIRKRELYSALAKDGMTLKDWFLGRADLYLRDHLQRPLPLVAEQQTPYFGKQSR
jgi:hypothetical protein